MQYVSLSGFSLHELIRKIMRTLLNAQNNVKSIGLFKYITQTTPNKCMTENANKCLYLFSYSLR